MTSRGIYRSAAGETRVKALYDSLVSTLDHPVDREWHETRFGKTHVLTTGPETGPPLLVFHGGNMVNPVSLPWFLPLAEEFRVVAPDTPGHPGYSTQHRLSPRDHAYATWVIDLMDSLGLDQAAMVGPSYGGGIVLRTAAYAPDRITRAGLLVPAGLGTGSLLRMLWRIFLPMVLYRLAPSRPRLHRAIQPIYTDPVDSVDDRVVELVGTVFTEVRMERTLPATVTPADLAGFTAPTFLAAAEHDVFFPAEVIIPHATETIQHLDTVIRLDGQRHIPSAQTRADTIDHLHEFLTHAH